VIRCYITDRRMLEPGETLVDAIARNVAAGVDWVQIREKDLSALALAELVRSVWGAGPRPAAASQAALGRPRHDGRAGSPAQAEGLPPTGTRKGAKIIVNNRLDVALALGADGAHLPSDSPAPNTWRRIVPQGFLIGVSCHTVEEVREAQSGGADYVLFGPVFAPISKDSPLGPRGLTGLAEAAGAVQIPVLALGGITEANTQPCIESGAAGIAGISLFQKTFQK
jgi:thiamine-phosphate pyrophosphorylase